jgi:hypothetical protein
MSLLGKKIILKGISQKGKNRVREQGDRWTVLAETNRLLFAPNDNGPWLFIAPKGMTHDDNASRWIRGMDDKDFSITVDD